MNAEEMSVGISQSLPARLSCSTSDSDLDCWSPLSAESSDGERPERMRDWLIRWVQVVALLTFELQIQSAL